MRTSRTWPGLEGSEGHGAAFPQVVADCGPERRSVASVENTIDQELAGIIDRLRLEQIPGLVVIEDSAFRKPIQSQHGTYGECNQQ